AYSLDTSNWGLSRYFPPPREKIHWQFVLAGPPRLHYYPPATDEYYLSRDLHVDIAGLHLPIAPGGATGTQRESLTAIYHLRLECGAARSGLGACRAD